VTEASHLTSSGLVGQGEKQTSGTVDLVPGPLLAPSAGQEASTMPDHEKVS
jgi:hypothetical protein